MPIYSTTIEGRKAPILHKAESLAKAKDQLLKSTSLSAEEVEEAFAEGAKLWKPGEPLPADEGEAEGE